MSRAIAVKKEIKRVLDTLEGLAGTGATVSYGLPKGVPDKRWAFVGRVFWSDTEWQTNRRQAEKFTVTVGFSVIITASGAEEAETLVSSYATEFHARLLDDKSIGGHLISSTFKRVSLDSWPKPSEGYEAQLICEVQCQAQPL